LSLCHSREVRSHIQVVGDFFVKFFSIDFLLIVVYFLPLVGVHVNVIVREFVDFPLVGEFIVDGNKVAGVNNLDHSLNELTEHFILFPSDSVKENYFFLLSQP